MRELQLFELNALKDIIDFCDLNDIKYSLSDGTLLGAVRHKGFIPWDDDIDITMPIDDYYKFLNLAPKKLGNKYYVQSCFSDKYFNRAYTRVRVNSTTMTLPSHLNRETHQGVWIDIFPVFGVKSKLQWKIIRILIKFLKMFQMDEFYEDSVDYIKSKSSILPMVLRIWLFIPIQFRQNWHIKLLKHIFGHKNTKYETYVGYNVSKIYPKKMLSGECRKIMFEDSLFNAYAQSEKYLEITYGDYMMLPPKEQRINHIDGMIVDLQSAKNKYSE